MRSKFSSIWRVAIALVMVLSLGLVMAAPAAALTAATVTNAPQTIGVAATYTVVFNTLAALSGTDTITITFPDDTTVPASTAPYDGKVMVNGTWCGDGKVTGVTSTRVVTITVPKAIPAGAVTVVISKGAEVKNPTTQADNWKLKVKTTAEPADVNSAVYSTVAPVPPTLTVDITEPTGATVSKLQEFTVKAVVTNSGGSTATGVKATITITGSATLTTGASPQSLADLVAVGGSATATWTVTCTAAGAVTIKVTPSGKYLYVETPLGIPEANLNFDQIAVTQQLAAALEVTAVTAPSTVKVGETFTATATVKNTGGAKAKEVALTLTITGSADLTADETAEKTKTDVAGLAEIAGGASVNVPWLLLCTAPGDAVITVTPTAGKDANTKGDIGTLTPRSTIVVQTEAAVLEVTITVPSEDPSSYLVGETFTVTATVNNTGASTAKDVALTLTILDAKCALKASEVATKPVGYLAPGETSGDVTWELVCTAPGKDKITVSPSGKDVLTGTAIPAGSLISDSVTVLQSVTTAVVPLHMGWNLISLPLIPIDPTIGTVLAGVGKGVTVNKVAYYTGGPAGSWLSWFPPPTPIDLYQMKDGNGYWIDVTLTNGSSLTVTGVGLALPGQVPPTYNIVVGWNLIGFTSKETKTAAQYLGPAVKLTIEAMYSYENGVYTAIAKTDALTPGLGYWLAVNAAGKIYP